MKPVNFFSVSGLISRSVRIVSNNAGSRDFISASNCDSKAPTRGDLSDCVGEA